MAPMYFAKILVLYPKRLKTSNVYCYKSVKAIYSTLILKDLAILSWKQIDFFYVTVSQCKWVSGVDTYEAEIAADSIIWELFAKNQLKA